MKPYVKITIWYISFGILWIILSDWIFAGIAQNIEQLSRIQTIKGWIYVLLSGCLVFSISRKAFNDEMSREREKRSIFKRTLEGTFHILLNYLNQMQLVTLEAAQSKDFDAEVLKTAQNSTESTKQALLKLDHLESITEEDIKAAVYGGQSGVS